MQIGGHRSVAGGSKWSGDRGQRDTEVRPAEGKGEKRGVGPMDNSELSRFLVSEQSRFMV
jgi:hypothetical protein